MNDYEQERLRYEEQRLQLQKHALKLQVIQVFVTMGIPFVLFVLGRIFK
jgi:hypothetical protein